MKPTRYALLTAAAAILLWFFVCGPESPVLWEDRATLSVHGEAAGTVPELLESAFFSEHLREISDFDGTVQASAIPGTQLVEISLREDSAAHVRAGMDALLNRISPVMGYFSEDFSYEVVLRSGISQHSSDRDHVVLLLAAVAVLLLLLPAPRFRGELDLACLLGRVWKLTGRFWPLALALSLLVGLGWDLYQTTTYTPVFQASAVVSLGDYDAETAPLLPVVVKGLLGSDLLEQHLAPDWEISVEAAGSSNLFTLTARASTQDSAQSALDTLLARWPELAEYALIELPMEIHQADPAGDMPQNPLSHPAILCKVFLLGLLCWTGLAFAIILFRQNIDTAAPKAYNESQS